MSLWPRPCSASGHGGPIPRDTAASRAGLLRGRAASRKLQSCTSCREALSCSPSLHCPGWPPGPAAVSCRLWCFLELAPSSGALGGWQQLSHGTWSLRSVASKARWRRLWHGSGRSPAKGCGRSLSLTRTAAPTQLHTCVGLCKPERPAVNETTPGRRGRRQGLQCEPGACPWAGSHIGPADTARRRRG